MAIVILELEIQKRHSWAMMVIMAMTAGYNRAVTIIVAVMGHYGQAVICVMAVMGCVPLLELC